MSKFKVGDVVKVIDRGMQYVSYTSIGSRYPAWKANAEPKRLTKYDIIGIHEDVPTGAMRDTIYAVQNASGQVYLFGELGLEKVEDAPIIIEDDCKDFIPEAWMRVDTQKDAGVRGMVVDIRQLGNSNNAACWLVDDDNDKGLTWNCNQAFRKLSPLDSAAMLLKLHDLEMQQNG